MDFKEVDINSLQINPFTMLNREWGLVTAGKGASINTMTVSWGALGVMWGKPVAMVFLRPLRYTKEFVDANDSFTLSFYPEGYRSALTLLGSKSGRDGDKIGESGLTPLFVDGVPAFEEARTIFVCRKMFGGQQLDGANFVDADSDADWYPEKDYHYAYFGAVEKVLISTKG